MSVKVVRGEVTTNSLNYKLGSETIVKGGLIRIDSSGNIVLPEATGVGAIHGIALAGSADADYSAGDKFPIALFDKDTEFAIPCEASTAAEDYTVGVSYGLNVNSGSETINLDETSGILQVIGVPGDDQQYNPDVDDTVNEGNIYVKLAQATLDGRAA